MRLNVGTEVAWIPTTQGPLTVRDVLLRAHQSEVKLDMSIPGYLYGAISRFLESVLALVIRVLLPTPSSNPVLIIEELLETGLPESAVDAALAKLSKGMDLFDAETPFMQRPGLKPASAKDSARKLARGHQPVKKLSPAMPPKQAEDFWNLTTARPETLKLPEAILGLVGYHYYSLAGNNSYDGDKCQMGAPGIRFLGIGNTATELIWVGPSLLATLSAHVPISWIRGDGLPAWSDRVGKQSIGNDGVEHPLWRATWSSNTAVCLWEDDELVGVRVGGVPTAWWSPAMGTTKDSVKAWWDKRNTVDPHYFYRPNKQGELKAVRVDIGRDEIDLAVEWAAEQTITAAAHAHTDVLLPPSSSDELRLIFIQHQLEGTGSSPSIRYSAVMEASRDKWVLDSDTDLQEEVRSEAEFVRTLSIVVRSPFRRPSFADSNAEVYPYVLDALSDRQDDASNAFWRLVAPVYQEMIREARGANEISAEIRKKAGECAVQAFKETVEAYAAQDPARLAYVDGYIRRRVKRTVSKQIRPNESEL